MANDIITTMERKTREKNEEQNKKQEIQDSIEAIETIGENITKNK